MDWLTSTLCFPSSQFVRLLSPPKHHLVKSVAATPFEVASLPPVYSDFHNTTFEVLRVETLHRIESRPQGAYSWVCPESAELVTTPVREDTELLLGAGDAGGVADAMSVASSAASFFEGWTFPAFTASADTTPLSATSLHSLTYSASSSAKTSSSAQDEGARVSLLGSTQSAPFTSSSDAAPWAVTDGSEDDSPGWMRM